MPGTPEIQFFVALSPSERASFPTQLSTKPPFPSTAAPPACFPTVLRRYSFSCVLLNVAEAFERFLHTRYVGQKRFGLEGAESAIALLDAILDEAAQGGIEEAVLGMAHRGRLNVLANIVGKSYREIFAEFEGNLDPESVQGSGDVKYHKGASGKFSARNGAELPVTLASNPSHLEAVDPVVEGIARARHDQRRDPGHYHVLPVLIHGDAAFAGQGVVAETLEPLPAARLQDRWDRAPRDQQPARFHDSHQSRPFVVLPDRRREDGAGTDLPCERRRPGGVRARGPPGVRVPRALPQRRRDRHGLLPAARPQRG